MPPAERAVGEDVQERGAVGLRRERRLSAQVLPVRARRRLGDVGDPVRGRDRGQVFALLHLAEGDLAGRARRRRGAERRRAGALDPGVHVGLVVVADEHEAMAALERPGECLEADVVGAAVAGEGDDRHLVRLRERAAATERPIGALDAAGSGGRILEGDVEPGDVPRRGRVARRRHLETAGRADDDDWAVDRVEDRPDDHRNAAALAERVPAAERRRPSLVADEHLQT